MNDLASDRTRDGLDRPRDASYSITGACVVLAAVDGSRTPEPASAAP